MLDPSIQHLLEQVIDSPIKLQLCLLFYENQRLEGTAAQLANRIYRDIWSTHEALRELAEDGVLAEVGANAEPRYSYQPCSELAPALLCLAQSYNEPFERDTIQHVLRDIASYARYRRANRSSTFEFQGI